MTGHHTCRICSAPAGRVHRCAERRAGTGEVFSYAECSSCGTLQLLDVPDDLSAYDRRCPDAPAVVPAVDGSLRRAARSVRARFVLSAPPACAARVANRLRPRWDTWLRGTVDRPGQTIVDIGCGRGQLLTGLYNDGFRNVVGYDPHLPGSPGRGPVPVHREFPTGLAGRARLVMLHHSLGHMRDPARALTDAAALLAPDGYVLVRGPLADSFVWRQYRTYWYALDPPRHLFVLTERSLTLVAGAAGLSVVRTWRDSTAEQFALSEQVRRGGDGDFTDAQRRAFSRWADELNRNGDGDTGCFVLARRRSTARRSS